MYRKTEKTDGAVTIMATREEFEFLAACFEVGYEGWDDDVDTPAIGEMARGVAATMRDGRV